MEVGSSMKAVTSGVSLTGKSDHLQPRKAETKVRVAEMMAAAYSTSKTIPAPARRMAMIIFREEVLGSR